MSDEVHSDPEGRDADQTKLAADADRAGHGRSERQSRINRRRFIGLSAAGGVAATAAVLGLVGLDDGPRDDKAAVGGLPRPEHPSTHTPETTPTTVPASASTKTVLTAPTSAAVVAENARTGTAWWVTTPQQAGDIEGFADQVSAVVGDTVTLYVSTVATSFRVQAYRMGYYQGIGARMVWQSHSLPGVRQPPPTLRQSTNTIECQWSPSLSFTIDRTWPPGAYLLKLVGATGEQQFVPLCLRDDSSTAAFVIQHSVTTWQAYNRWGGYSLYYGNADGALSYTHAPGPGATFADRARTVSFDRPYDHDWASGAADFVGNELPVIYQAEQLGLDVTYWTDLDLHARPALLSNHRALISLGHDEYWSQAMRDAAESALAGGVNLAFLGANACYRQIRLQPSALGTDRVQVCFKSAAEDPMLTVNPALVTVNWPDPPVSRPESELIGIAYQDVGASAAMVISDPTSWLLTGTGITAGQHIPGLIQGEFDRYVPGGRGATNVDVIGHSVIADRGGNYSDMTWYTVPGGGGVFASGTAFWVGAMSDSTLIPPNVLPDAIPGVTNLVLDVMENLYAVLGSGPASTTRPSQGSWRSVYANGTPAVKTPVPSEMA